MYSDEMAKRAIKAETLDGVGIRLRMVRAVLDHSQADWARALQVTPQLLNKWEQGTRLPNLDILIVICESSGCTLDFVFRGRIGLDMRQELREALARASGDPAYTGWVRVLYTPPAPPSKPSSRARKRRK